MPCPLHLSFGKEWKLSRDLYNEISREWRHSKGTFTGATGSLQLHLLHCKSCLKLPHPTYIYPSPTGYLSCCPVLRVALGGIAGEQTVFSFLLRPLYANYSQIPHFYKRHCLLCQLGLFLAKSLYWQGHLSKTGRFAFSLPALTLLQLLALLRVDGKLNVHVFQNFSSVLLFPFWQFCW